MPEEEAFDNLLLTLARRMRPGMLRLVNSMPYARFHLAQRHARQRDPVLRTAFFIYANYLRCLLGKEPLWGCSCCGSVAGPLHYFRISGETLCVPCHVDFREWKRVYREDSVGMDSDSSSSCSYRSEVSEGQFEMDTGVRLTTYFLVTRYSLD